MGGYYILLGDLLTTHFRGFQGDYECQAVQDYYKLATRNNQTQGWLRLAALYYKLKECPQLSYL